MRTGTAQSDTPRIVIDGIRNLGEIDYLRDRFGHRFFLFALECQKSQRWERLRPVYERAGLTQADFDADDKRDKDEEVRYGQQVQLCVDRSDVLVANDPVAYACGHHARDSLAEH